MGQGDWWGQNPEVQEGSPLLQSGGGGAAADSALTQWGWHRDPGSGAGGQLAGKGVLWTVVAGLRGGSGSWRRNGGGPGLPPPNGPPHPWISAPTRSSSPPPPPQSLLELHKRRKALTEPEARYYLRQIVLGCQYLHRNRVIHRDLKLGNLFLNEDLEVKIGEALGLRALMLRSSGKGRAAGGGGGRSPGLSWVL